MHEYLVNLHMHTPYSDGHGSHAEIAQAALKAGLDVVIVTDHNVWVNGPEDYYQDEDERRVLLLVGEEVHDQARAPQKNHMLIFGADQELAPMARDPQRLIEAARQAGGLTFLAHPHDPESPTFGEANLSWVSWEVHGYTGIELWNAMSEFKSLLSGRPAAIYYAFNPQRVAHGPFSEVLAKWDELLTSGQRVVAVGGSDAHALRASMGPLKRTLFPYEFHFQAINTHILTPEPFNGDVNHDRALVYAALKQGHAFVGYDLPAPTRGFTFKAQGFNSLAWMGDEVSANQGVTLQIRLPQRAETSLIHNGQTIKTWTDRELCTYTTTTPGAYRVEVKIEYLGKQRGWIYSNPIYVR
ncbi:MAG: PHP domain-containing protein [Anaerolineales bacterium]|nr:PHP domain-containing protein [Anaerolineales bacterium]